MSHTLQTFRRWFLLPVVLVGVHTLMVISALAACGFVHDRYGHPGISGTIFDLFAILDYPGPRLLWKQSVLEPSIFFLCLGTVHWGIIGLLIQAAWRWLQARRIAPSENDTVEETGPACVRCGKRMPDGSKICPLCGWTQPVYDHAA
jgi:hypothetical protein